MATASRFPPSSRQGCRSFAARATAPRATSDRISPTSGCTIPASRGATELFDRPPRSAIAERAFKTPTLREVARTAPYMHDGSLADARRCRRVLRRWRASEPDVEFEIHPLQFSVEEKQVLVAFLKSLSGSMDDDVEHLQYKVLIAEQQAGLPGAPSRRRMWRPAIQASYGWQKLAKASQRPQLRQRRDGTSRLPQPIEIWFPDLQDGGSQALRRASGARQRQLPDLSAHQPSAHVLDAAAGRPHLR